MHQDEGLRRSTCTERLGSVRLMYRSGLDNRRASTKPSERRDSARSRNYLQHAPSPALFSDRVTRLEPLRLYIPSGRSSRAAVGLGGRLWELTRSLKMYGSSPEAFYPEMPISELAVFGPPTGPGVRVRIADCVIAAIRSHYRAPCCVCSISEIVSCSRYCGHRDTR